HGLERLAPALGLGWAEPDGEPSYPCPDAEGSTVHVAGLNRPSGASPVHGVPFNRAPRLARLEDLDDPRGRIGHHQISLGEEGAEALPDFTWNKCYHVTAEIIVNRFLGNI